MSPRKQKRKQSDWHALSTDHWQSEDGFTLVFDPMVSAWTLSDSYGKAISEQLQLFPSLRGAPLQWANEALAKAGF